jgi:uncharacterized protein (TIGR00725 family)
VAENPFPQRTIIAVCGAGACDPELEALAEDVGRALARSGAVLLCGGLGGVMEAACKGAREAGGLTVGVLPGADVGAANPHVVVPIATGMGEARNAIIVQTAGAVIAIGGEYGTLSEIALARKRGKLVVGLQTWELGAEAAGQPRVVRARSPEEAVQLALSAAQVV